MTAKMGNALTEPATADARPPADRWKKDQVIRIGNAIRVLRGRRSAAWLSDATAELGERVERSTITDIETGRRRYVGIHELSVLALALGATPAALLTYGSMPDGPVSVAPGLSAPAHVVSAWWGGEAMSPFRWSGQSVWPLDTTDMESPADIPAPDVTVAALFAASRERNQLRHAQTQFAGLNSHSVYMQELRAQLCAAEAEITACGGVLKGRSLLTVTLGLDLRGRVVRFNLNEVREGGAGPHMVITGPAGSGKTDLAGKLCAQLAHGTGGPEWNRRVGAEVIVYARPEVRHCYPEDVVFLDAAAGDEDPHDLARVLNDLLESRVALFREANVEDIGHFRAAGNQMSDTVIVLDDQSSWEPQEEASRAVARVARTGRSAGIHLIAVLTDSPSVTESPVYRLGGTVIRLGVEPGQGVCTRHGVDVPAPVKFLVLHQPGPG